MGTNSFQLPGVYIFLIVPMVKSSITVFSVSKFKFINIISFYGKYFHNTKFSKHKFRSSSKLVLSSIGE